MCDTWTPYSQPGEDNGSSGVMEAMGDPKMAAFFDENGFASLFAVQPFLKHFKFFQTCLECCFLTRCLQLQSCACESGLHGDDRKKKEVVWRTISLAPKSSNISEFSSEAHSFWSPVMNFWCCHFWSPTPKPPHRKSGWRVGSVM